MIAHEIYQKAEASCTTTSTLTMGVGIARKFSVQERLDEKVLLDKSGVNQGLMPSGDTLAQQIAAGTISMQFVVWVAYGDDECSIVATMDTAYSIAEQSCKIVWSSEPQVDCG